MRVAARSACAELPLGAAIAHIRHAARADAAASAAGRRTGAAPVVDRGAGRQTDR